METFMKRSLIVFFLLAFAAGPAGDQAKPAQTTTATVAYGANAAVGRTFVHDGIKLYYEVYGAGEPLLMIHGNGGSIADMRIQMAYFRNRYKVIAMDSRDQGRSGDSPDALTYEKMTDDLAALLDHLKTGPVNVLGWSDGGIEALLLGIRHPAKVRKIVSMAANLNPSADAIYPEVIGLIKTMLDGIPAAARRDPKVQRELKVTAIALREPNIPLKALESIAAPTLVLAGDHDIVREEHTLAIFQHIPNSQLAIFPNATHMAPIDDPVLFNSTVDRFLRTPFVKKDRINDLMKSLEKLRGPAKTPAPVQ